MLWQRGQAYSQDLRDRVFAVADAGTPVGQIADMLLVSSSYVSKVLIRRRRTGETSARPQCCHVPAKLSHYHAAIRDRWQPSLMRRWQSFGPGWRRRIRCPSV